MKKISLFLGIIGKLLEIILYFVFDKNKIFKN
jgi:hypothetical protein